MAQGDQGTCPWARRVENAVPKPRRMALSAKKKVTKTHAHARVMMMTDAGLQPPQRRSQPVRRRNRRAQPPRRSRSHLVASPHARTSNGSGIPFGAARQRGAAATRAYELLPSSWQLCCLDLLPPDSWCPCKRLIGHLPTLAAHNVTLYGAPNRPYGGEEGSQRPSCC